MGHGVSFTAPRGLSCDSAARTESVALLMVCERWLPRGSLCAELPARLLAVPPKLPLNGPLHKPSVRPRSADGHSTLAASQSCTWTHPLVAHWAGLSLCASRSGAGTGGARCLRHLCILSEMQLCLRSPAAKLWASLSAGPDSISGKIPRSRPGGVWYQSPPRTIDVRYEASKSTSNVTHYR